MSALYQKTRCCTPQSCELHRSPGFTTEYSPAKYLPNIPDTVLGNCYPNKLSRSLTVFHPKNIYNCARDTVYQRFSPKEWMRQNSDRYDLSCKERGISDRIRSDCYRAVKEADVKTKNRQTDNTKRLINRTSDIAFWKQELSDEMKAMEQEMDCLDEHRRILDKSYQDTFKPLKIAEECLVQREQRKDIDKVHDDVEKNLSKEVCMIKTIQDKMRKLLYKIDAQQKLNRAALLDCEKDASDKHHAQNLDDRMAQLRNHSSGLAYHPGIECFDNTITNPDGWINFTRSNIMKSQREREESEKLRGDVDAFLRQASNSIWHSFNNVNNSFESRIRETQDARNKLQAHLNRTNQALFDMEKNIDLLKKAVFDKEAPLKVAQTRLEERTRRMNVESCNDESMKGLIREVNEIKDAIRYLREKLGQAEAALSRLRRTKSILEYDIAIKENSLTIDGKNCMGMRRSFPTESSYGAILSVPTACC